VFGSVIFGPVVCVPGATRWFWDGVFTAWAKNV